ncbi:hypothetical protein CBR_g29291 [Chara braunii]|uniref:Chromo domain-containing protein n=1 Tax=Chara braunii TaxID=69332 RepID=A0A388LAA1_CHABU|nr:hypothetical protein CBR_g29291 [Chara braunii]|eukprot:GBG79240.1 hypothetical protein CBR_g29291 [Chara braunii]
MTRAFGAKGFPNCFGAIDCTHVYVDKPANAPSENYFDRKQQFSVAQVVVDLDMRILDVFMGYPGSVNDQRVLRNSSLFRRAEAGELFVAESFLLPGGVSKIGYLLGDNGYSPRTWMVVPYGGTDQAGDIGLFDTRQKTTRGVVDRAFGRLKGIRRLFLHHHKTNMDSLPQQFLAVCIIHNLLLEAGIPFDDSVLLEPDKNGNLVRVDLGLQDPPRPVSQLGATDAALALRDGLRIDAGSREDSALVNFVGGAVNSSARKRDIWWIRWMVEMEGVAVDRLAQPAAEEAGARSGDGVADGVGSAGGDDTNMSADDTKSSVLQSTKMAHSLRDTGPFLEGEKVLAYHGPLIYEAKTQKAEFRKKEWRYYVHYLGWSKNWDEWVGIERLMKYTEANLLKQKKLFKQNAERKKLTAGKAGKAGGVAGGGGGSGGGKGRRRRADSSMEERDGEEPEQAFRITFPGTLKKQLIDDWKQITQEGELVCLPREPTVNQILDNYLELKTKRESGNDTWKELVAGMKTYFNKALGAMLLYKSEREQFEAATGDEESPLPVEIYGAEHLLRMFVKLPELIQYTNMEPEAMSHLQAKLNDFLKFLQKNQTSFFLSNYGGKKK